MKANGGDAFPAESVESTGMSLREWFAGQALPGVIASTKSAVGGSLDPVIAARLAFDYADEMIARRKKHERTD